MNIEWFIFFLEKTWADKDKLSQSYQTKSSLNVNTTCYHYLLSMGGVGETDFFFSQKYHHLDPCNES